MPQATFTFVLFARRLLHGYTPPPSVIFQWILLARHLLRREVETGLQR